MQFIPKHVVTLLFLVMFLLSGLLIIEQGNGLVATIRPRIQSQPAAVVIDANTTYQTIVGWEATAQVGQFECQSFDQYKDEVFDQAIMDLGINRVRLEIYSGAENPTDYFTQWLSGQRAYEDWRPYWHEVINDNNNPQAINSHGFQFSFVDHAIDKVVLPLRQRLSAKGESLYVNLNVVDFSDAQGASNIQYQNDPEEYAELILATFLHIQNKYGWVPDAVEIILEPDAAVWGDGTSIGNALVKTGDLLKANGFTPDFVAPSTTSMERAVPYFDAMIGVEGASSYISELSYHRYTGVSQSSLQQIASRAVQYGIGSAMLEYIGADYINLHEDLTVGRVTSWQQYTLAFCEIDNGAQYYLVNESNPAQPIVEVGGRTRFLQQYFKYIRRGAVRIEADSDQTLFDPVAFINADGKYVVVVKANGGGSFEVQGLPAGTYGINYTTDTNCQGFTPSQYNVESPSVVIGDGETVSTSIETCGVVTIYGIINAPPSGTATPTVTSSATATHTPHGSSTATPSATTVSSLQTSTATSTPTATEASAPSTTPTPRATGTTQLTATATATQTGATSTSTPSRTSTATATPTLDCPTPPEALTATTTPQTLATSTIVPLTSTATSTPTPTATVRSTRPGTLVPPLDLIITGPSIVSLGVAHAFTSAIVQGEITTPITYTWCTTDHAPIVQSGAMSQTIDLVWSSPGMKQILVTIRYDGGTANQLYTVTVVAPAAFLPEVYR